jgi:hypothetical protein
VAPVDDLREEKHRCCPSGKGRVAWMRVCGTVPVDGEGGLVPCPDDVRSKGLVVYVSQSKTTH